MSEHVPTHTILERGTSLHTAPLFMQSFGDHSCLVKAHLDATDPKRLRVEVDGHAKTATIARFDQVSGRNKSEFSEKATSPSDCFLLLCSFGS